MSQVLPDRIDGVRVVNALDLLDRYEAWLLDAYGVLVDSNGPLPGAAQFLEKLAASSRTVLIVSNDASRLPESASRRFLEHGLVVPPESIITGGTLLAPLYAEHGWEGVPTAVLGTPDSAGYVAHAGGEVIAPSRDAAIWVIGDEEGYPFLETVDAAITAIFHRLDAGDDVHLVIPNPDRIHPQGVDQFAITAGSVAKLLSDAVEVRYGTIPSFHIHELGKPHRPIFEAALARTGDRSVVMVGDQLGTDILGAVDVGIPSALVTSGLAKVDKNRVFDTVRPDWILRSLA